LTARAIVDPKNPLTARVFVNRVWLHHFGAGLVTTPSDFGVRSEQPSHPELLDWLAGEFVRSGWKVKNLHRLIMNGAAYQMAGPSSIAKNQNSADQTGLDQARWKRCTKHGKLPAVRSLDPENRLLSHMNRRRTIFETQRDSLLAVSGTWDRSIGGPPSALSIPRRTLYTFVNRMDVPPVMTTFDFPSPSTSCPERVRTTIAPQALYLMNNDFPADCAAACCAGASGRIGSVGGQSGPALHDSLPAGLPPHPTGSAPGIPPGRHPTKSPGSSTVPCFWRMSSFSWISVMSSVDSKRDETQLN
jgi:hypothetical protein